MSRQIYRRSNIVLPVLYTTLVILGLALPYLYDGWLEYLGPALLLPVFGHALLRLFSRAKRLI